VDTYAEARCSALNQACRESQERRATLLPRPLGAAIVG